MPTKKFEKDDKRYPAAAGEKPLKKVASKKSNAAKKVSEKPVNKVGKKGS